MVSINDHIVDDNVIIYYKKKQCGTKQKSGLSLLKQCEDYHKLFSFTFVIRTLIWKLPNEYLNGDVFKQPGHHNME